MTSSVGGLAIGIGKVANGSIIMVENIYRLLQEKQDRTNTTGVVAEAAKEVGNYLFSANLLIILVFLPLLTLQGLEGAMFRPTAFAVAAALFGSLVLNLTLQPVLPSVFLTGRRIKGGDAPVNRLILRAYRFLLLESFRFRIAFLVLFLLLTAGAAYAYTLLGKEFAPPLDEGAILVSTVMCPASVGNGESVLPLR